MHRSGTSAVAQLISKWGAFMGEDLMKPNEFNPDGFFEYNPLVSFHEKILQENNSSWYAPPMGISDEYLIERYRDEALGLVADMDRAGKTWCWKDPRTAIFLDFWTKVLNGRDLIFIIVHRDVSKISASLHLRDKLPGPLTVGLWEYHTLNIFKTAAGRNNYFIINYDQLVGNTQEEGRKLFQFLNQRIQEPGKSFKDIRWNEIIREKLNRSRPMMEIRLTPLQEELLTIFDRKVIPASFSPSPEAISRLHEIFSLIRDPSVTVQPLRFAQLYYHTANQGFSEENSLIRFNPGKKERFSFTLSGISDLNLLRFDPLNDYANITIHEITFLKNGEKTEFPTSLSSNAFRQNGNSFLFDTTDPQIFINTEENGLFSPDTLILETEYTETGASALDLVTKLMQGKLDQQHAEAKRVTGELQLVVSSQSEKIKEQDETIKETGHTLLELQNNLAELNDNLRYLQNIQTGQYEQLMNLQSIHTAQNEQLMTLQKDHAVQNEHLMNLQKIHADQNEQLQHMQTGKFYRLLLFFVSGKRWINALFHISRLRQEIRVLKHIRLVKKSGLFDESYYLSTNPDVIPSLLTAARHFILYGGSEGRNPSEQFNAAGYLAHNPDVTKAGINPLVHYLQSGRAEKRAGGLSSGSGKEQGRKAEKGNNLLEECKKKLVRLTENPEIRLIRESRYFNASYYRRLNIDVEVSKMDPASHWFHFGWKEGRNPGPEFDTVFYLQTYEDVKKQMINPLVHYLRYGEAEKRLPKPFEYDENQCMADADLTDTEVPENQEVPGKIAIVCHLFHVDLADEFMGYFRQIPFPCDLFITTSETNRVVLQETLRHELPDVKCTVLSYPNAGRDVAPFLHILGNYLKNYSLACKVHTKKSGHDHNLEGWRAFMLDQLLGNPAIVQRIVRAFMENENLGLVWPLPHPYLKHLGIDRGWGPALSRENNHAASRRYFPDLQLPGPDEPFGFPAGNMFWFRPAALEYLVKKEFQVEDFGNESGQIDGTLAHAIERVTGRVAEKSGYTTASVFFPAAAIENDRDSPIDFPEGSRKILFIAHDLFRAGAEMVLLHILNWLKKHTAYKLFVLALKKGNDGGKLLPAYRRAATIILLDELLAGHPEEMAISMIKKTVGNPDLIYGNTILAANIYPWLSEFRAPVVTHIHEMEESIRRYTTPEIMANLIRTTSAFIPCSTPVSTNLERNHGIPPGILHQIEEFIRIDSQPLPRKSLQRKKMGLPPGKVIIWGCGTIYWRKGTDLFIETAGIVKSLGEDNFLFCWIGSNHWNNDASEWGEWQKQEGRIMDLSLQEHVLFIGEKERPKDYFKAGDLYYLPSREDPYPLVCLEAAECELPVVCFDGAGGMPGFVEEDAGVVVPFKDTRKAAESIAELINNPDLRTKLGKTARKKLLQRHTDDSAAPRILNLCRTLMKTPPAISVVVPVYNHAPFLRERLDSILNQRFRDVEVIVLDDLSTDSSVEVASEYLSHPAVRLIRNTANSGSPFRQWQRGVAEARGPLVWIAEGDDSADPDFLSTLIHAFHDDNTVMAYCGSHCTDNDGAISRQHYLRSGHYEGLGYPRERWLSDYVADGEEEIIQALSIRNTIPNVSAVLFRRRAFDHVDFQAADQYATAGDWRIYLSILAHGQLAYFHQHLNYHRIRSASVVGSHKTEAVNTLPDYFKMHRYISETYEVPASIRELMVRSVTGNLRKLWPEMEDEEFLKLYDPVLIRKG